MKLKNAILASLLCSTIPVHAEWYKTSADEYFGPEVSEKTACRNAENTALSGAIQRATGQTITASQFQICNDTNKYKAANKDICQLLTSTSATTEGIVVAIRDKSQEVIQLTNQRICRVSLEADIKRDAGQIDTSFDPEIRLEKTMLKDGETVRVIVRPNVPLYITLFVYSPYLQDFEQVQRIYPNTFEPSKRIKHYTEFPSRDSAYSFNAYFPSSYDDTEQVGEILIAVATKTEIPFRTRFNFAEFNARLQEIPKSDRRIVKIPYFIASSKSEKFR